MGGGQAYDMALVVLNEAPMKPAHKMPLIGLPKAPRHPARVSAPQGAARGAPRLRPAAVNVGSERLCESRCPAPGRGFKARQPPAPYRRRHLCYPRGGAGAGLRRRPRFAGGSKPAARRGRARARWAPRRSWLPRRLRARPRLQCGAVLGAGGPSCRPASADP